MYITIYCLRISKILTNINQTFIFVKDNLEYASVTTQIV